MKKILIATLLLLLWKMKDYAFIFAVLLLIAANSAAQVNPPARPNPFEIFNRKIAENNYLSPLVELEKDEFAKSAEWRSVLPDLLGYLYSYTGDYKTAYAQIDRTRERSLDEPFYKDLKSSPIDAFEPQDAIETIVTLAEKNQVVMINEEHDAPLHRAFTARLLGALYAKGFRYFAAETLGERDKDLMTRGYPTHKTGFYTSDPVFGELLRTALRLGFKIVPYESATEKLIECRKQGKGADVCQNERERGQAQNLYDRILRADPQAKILVHVGRGHNQQLKLETWAQMGWHFKDITGIKPLSVNQMLSERSEPKYESGLYRYVVGKWKIKEPSVFKNEAGDYFKTYGYDLAVFHPRSSFENGRPSWLKKSGARRAEAVNLKKLKFNHRNGVYLGAEPVLIQAFYAVESADAVPADQVILRPNQAAHALLLPKGEFRVRALDRAGKTLGEYRK